MTTDRNDPGLRKIIAEGPRKGQQEAYLVLSDEERAKGFVRPVRYKYLHLRCGAVTTMGTALSETCARDPHFYGGTFCCACGTHFPLRDFRPEAKPIDGWAFLWDHEGGEPVGSDVDEAREFNEAKRHRENEKNIGSGI